VLRAGRNIRLRTLLIVVAGCASLCGLGVQVYRELSPVRRSILQLRPGNSALTRIGAVSRLDNAGLLPAWEREDAYRVLLAAVNDTDAQVRSRAAIALGQYREHTDQVLGVLVGLMKDQVSKVRESVLVALERIVARGSAEVRVIMPTLIAALDDPKPAVRLEAARALYVLGEGKRALPALARMVREEKSGDRLGALGWLKALNAISAELEPALRVMTTSEQFSECFSARQALIQLGIPDRERDEVIDAMLKSSHDAERLEGAFHLLELGRSEQAAPILREIAIRGSKADRARADDLMRALRAQSEDVERRSELGPLHGRIGEEPVQKLQ
jgi:HEAT repeat protein